MGAMISRRCLRELGVGSFPEMMLFQRVPVSGRWDKSAYLKKVEIMPDEMENCLLIIASPAK